MRSLGYLSSYLENNFLDRLYEKGRTALGAATLIPISIYASQQISSHWNEILSYFSQLSDNSNLLFNPSPETIMLFLAPISFYFSDFIGAFLSAFAPPTIKTVGDTTRILGKYLLRKELDISYFNQINEYWLNACEYFKESLPDVWAGSFDDAFGGFLLTTAAYLTGYLPKIFEIPLGYKMLVAGTAGAIGDVMGDIFVASLYLLGLGSSKFASYLFKRSKTFKTLDKDSEKKQYSIKKEPQPVSIIEETDNNINQRTIEILRKGDVIERMDSSTLNDLLNRNLPDDLVERVKRRLEDLQQQN